MNIGVVGTGYVGLVAGVCFADAGHHVICIDNVPEKIEKLKKNQIPIYEPGLSDVMVRAQTRLQFSTDIKDAVEFADVLFIAVGTPPREDGSADLTATESVLNAICQHATKKKYVVLKSTVPIGTCRRLQRMAADATDQPIEIVNNPEFLKEGAAVEDFLKPDRVVVGCQTADAEYVMRELYEPFVRNGNPIMFMDNASAEMTKYAANAFLAVKISFVNELANLADRVGADINLVKRGFTSDSRINPAFFHPGVGYGGSCFPKDVSALYKTGETYDVNMLVSRVANDVNDRQKLILFQKVKNHYNELHGLKFAVWGLSFKPRTDDVRAAPALLMIEALHSHGASVKAYDPIAGPNAQKVCDKFELCEDAYDCLEDADGLLIATEWNEFRGADFSLIKSKMKTPVVFDGRNIFDPVKMKNIGFTYFCIGRESLARST